MPTRRSLDSRPSGSPSSPLPGPESLNCPSWSTWGERARMDGRAFRCPLGVPYPDPTRHAFHASAPSRVALIRISGMRFRRSSRISSSSDDGKPPPPPARGVQEAGAGELFAYEMARKAEVSAPSIRPTLAKPAMTRCTPQARRRKSWRRHHDRDLERQCLEARAVAAVEASQPEAWLGAWETVPSEVRAATLIGVLDDGCPFAAAHLSRDPAGSPAKHAGVWPVEPEPAPIARRDTLKAAPISERAGGLQIRSGVPARFRIAVHAGRQIGIDDWMKSHVTPARWHRRGRLLRRCRRSPLSRADRRMARM